MKTSTVKYIVPLVLLFILPAFPRDDILVLTIADFFNSPDVERLDKDVKLYFGDQPYPEIEKKLGIFKTNKKTNAWNKSDEKACNWVFLSALLQLQDRAKMEGGNAVVNIKSNYKNKPFSSQDKFVCGAGRMIAGCALIGTVVKLRDKVKPQPKKQETSPDSSEATETAPPDTGSK
jgi:hypothetical protein